MKPVPPEWVVALSSGVSLCPACWGTHGCVRPKGHAPPCLCDCCDHPNFDHHGEIAPDGCVGAPPYYGDPSKFFTWNGEPLPAHLTPPPIGLENT